jgi:type VI secretion system secreted protein VgrG
MMEAPATVNWATPASTALFAGQHLQWNTQADLHLTAAHTLASVTANAAGWFSHAGGIQAIAGNGPVSLQAHTDKLEILADQAITVISVNDVIEIKASKKITLQAGQSSVMLEGGNITFACPGNFTVKGGQHAFSGGGRSEASFPTLPSSTLSLFNRKLQLKDAGTGEPLAEAPYFIRLKGGTVYHGVTDAEGFTDIAQSDSAESAKAYVGHAAMKEIAKFTRKA